LKFTTLVDARIKVKHEFLEVGGYIPFAECMLNILFIALQRMRRDRKYQAPRKMKKNIRVTPRLAMAAARRHFHFARQTVSCKPNA
jgi:hypothetical protein